MRLRLIANLLLSGLVWLIAMAPSAAAPLLQAGSGDCDILNLDGLSLYLEARYTEALAQSQAALECYREIGDRAGEAELLHDVGRIYRRLGEYEQALEHYQQSLTISREMGDRAAERTTLNDIGLTYRSLGQYAQALDTYQQGLTISQEIGDRNGESESLNNIAGIYARLGQYEQALVYFQQSLTISQEIPNRGGEAATLNNIGFIYRKLGEYQQALENYQQGLTINQEVGNRAGEAQSLNNIGFVYDSLGQYEQALEYYQQSLAIRKEIGDRAGEAESLNSIGGIYDSWGQFAQALEYYQQSLAISQEIGNPAGESDSLNNIALTHRRLGQYKQALDTYQRSLAIRREIGDRAGEAESLHNIGRVYGSLGQYEQALDYYQQSLAIHKEIGDWAGEAASLNSIGALYTSLGQYEQALDYYQQSLTIHKEIGARPGEGDSLNNIGFIYQQLGQYEQALDHYRQGLAISQEIGDRSGEGISLNNIGSLYDRLGEYEQALEYYQQSLTIAREIGDWAGEGTSLNNIGGIYAILSQSAQALEYYRQSLTISQEIGDRAGEGISLDSMGLIYESLGQYEKALDTYQQAMETIEAVRAQVGSEEDRAKFIARYAGLYRGAVDLFHRQGQDDAAFFTTERGRARAFLDSLATSQVRLRDDDAADLLAQEQAGYTQRQAAQVALAKARALNSPDPKLVSDLEKQLAEAEATYEKAQAAIEAHRGQLTALAPGRSTGKTILGVAQVQALLDERTTLISYFVLEDKTLAFIITRHSFDTLGLEITPEQLTAQIRDFRDFADPTFPAYPASAITLYSWLIEPVKGHLNTPHLAIIPHGVLHYLPFAALTDGQRYLIDDYVLTMLPSASALPFIQENTGRELAAPLILGNPTSSDFNATAAFATERGGLGSLPFAEQEAKAIAALYGIEPLLGEAATEGAVRQRAPETGILHLAAHGYYNPVAPLSSLVALAPDQADDGWLTVGEVYGLDLSQADLVVLSACQTNLGQLSEGDELVGLTRAFIFAGTPSVLASLWSVEDESTALLMGRFYTHLRDGMGKAAALRQAQLEVREQHPNPFYWAAFVLSGDGGGFDDIPSIAGEEAGTTEEAEATAAQASPAALEAAPPPTESGTQEKQTRGGCLSMVLPLALLGLVLWRQRAALV